MPVEVSFETFLGMPAVVASRPMRELMSTVERVARTNAAVLIIGESGTGKELIARAIHHYSLRCSRPWVDISCAALPENLVESELFGHEKGAFSGADAAKPGLFELAHLGTLFLDEIGELDAKLQVKLLRVLDGVPYYRLGGTRKIHVDVRIVAATNRDLDQAVRDGRYRCDLFHRLSQINLRVPPLRDRVEDLVPLAEFFLRQHDESLRFSRQALEAIRRCSWPGNVRELRNRVVSAAAMARNGEVDVSDFPLEFQFDAPRLTPRSTCNLEGIEKQAILQALAQTGGHHKKAAELLGISSRTLTRKLQSWYEQGELA